MKRRGTTRSKAAQKSLFKRFGPGKRRFQGSNPPDEEPCGCNQCPPCPDEKRKVK